MFRWGILGPGNIAKRFAQGVALCEGQVITAAAGRNLEKMNWLDEGVKKYTDWDLFLQEAPIDGVYVALPHKMHKEWSITAMEAGKHVLCEKPAVTTKAEMLELIEAHKKSHVMYMEAMKSRFLPAYQEAKNIWTSQKIKEVKVQWLRKEKHADYFWQEGQAGILYDCGIYAISFLEDVLPGLTCEQSDIVWEGLADVDVRAKLAKGDVLAEFVCSCLEDGESMGEIKTEEGVLKIPRFYRAQDFEWNKERTEIPCNDFAPEIEHFVSCVQEGKTESPIMSLADSLACIDLMEKIKHIS